MCFPTFDAMKRTDSAFRNRQQPIHHKEYSLLEDLRNIDGEPLIDMIQQFPTSDPLHLLEEGVMKRLLRIWAKGTTIYKKKWSKPQIASFDINILTWNKELPSDINRKVRVMQFVKFWKATEFRTILLYYGLIAFKDLLGAQEYIHFLHLCLAIRIYSCRTYVAKPGFMRVAKALLSSYCTNFINIYGGNAVVSNIHNIIHISDDVERFGSLNDTSTYPFENFLRDIKLRVKPSNTPMQQITRRLAELFLDIDENEGINLDVRKQQIVTWVPELKYEFKSSNESVYNFIKITPNVFLSVKKNGDRWFLTKTGEIVEMKYAIRKNSSYFISGSAIKEKTIFFREPYSSDKTDIYVSNGDKNDMQLYDFKNIKAKMMCLSYGDQYVFIPILHSLDECAQYF